MKLVDAHGIISFGDWMASRGFKVGEGPGRYGPVTPGAHVPGSLHFKGLAYDVNFGVTGPDERQMLDWLYGRILNFRRSHSAFPLDEMFFNGHGFLKELGTSANHPISGHDDHLHVGFTTKRWGDLS